MEKIVTKDGSLTFHNSEFDETYHSVSGAKEEAMKKFVKPSKKYVSGRARILDVCFGLGYNSAAALDEWDCSIVGLEKDPEILNKILSINADFENYDEIKKAVSNESNKVKIIVGDALTEINKLKGEFDLVFFDPFSTKKMPDFWTYKVFSKLYKLLKKGGTLTTYSCARAVRDNLVKAGFKVSDVEPVGRRAPSTLAVKK